MEGFRGGWAGTGEAQTAKVVPGLDFAVKVGASTDLKEKAVAMREPSGMLPIVASQRLQHMGPSSQPHSTPVTRALTRGQHTVRLFLNAVKEFLSP